MRRSVMSVLIALLLVALSASCALAKKAATTHHETMGTKQLPGGFGKIGDTYTLGKTDPWNIKITGVEYTCASMMVGDALKIPNRDEKFMVVHLTVHNPRKGLALMRGDSFRITAVDSTDKNWESANVLNSETDKKSIGQQFKPGQKMNVYKVVTVPAAGEIPKMIVTGSDNPVIRYNLVGKVKALPEPYADPNDKSGATALSVVPAKIGDKYDSGFYSFSMDGVSYEEGPMHGIQPPSGGKFLLVSMTVKNINTFPLPIRNDNFEYVCADTDGGTLKHGWLIFRASSDGVLEGTQEVGQEIKFRSFFFLEKGVTPDTISMGAGSNPRMFKFKIPSP